MPTLSHKAMTFISWNDFTKLELRVGKIISAQPFPEAHKPAWKLVIDFGQELGTRQSSAQLTDLYQPQDLIDKQVVAVVNLAPKQIGPFMSECLVTGFANDAGEIVLCVPDRDVPLGARLH